MSEETWLDSIGFVKLAIGRGVHEASDHLNAYDLRCRMDRQQQWKDRKTGARSEVVAAKVADFTAKEDATMAQFRAMLGQQGGPITIKRRE